MTHEPLLIQKSTSIAKDNPLAINTIYFNLKIRTFLFVKWLLLLPLCRASLLRSAPFELPQGGNAARVEGCSGAIKVACPFFFPLPPEGEM